MLKRRKIMMKLIAGLMATFIAVISFTWMGVDVHANNQGIEGFVSRMYRIVLDREPDENGFRGWTQQLRSGEKAAADIVLGFFYSPEYLGKNKNNGQIVIDFYSAMLDREPDDTGYRNWVQRLDIGMTMRCIAYGFVNSPEFMALCDRYGINNGSVELSYARDYNFERTSFAYRLYKNCLGREPDTEGLDNWCAQLADGATGSDVAHGFIFSSEYWDKHTTNEEFVDMMYNTILGRVADQEGKTSWTDVLNYSNTREHVFNGFLFSSEFAEQCHRAEIRVGSQIYEPDSEMGWQYNIRVLELCNEQRQSNGIAKIATREDVWRDVACVRANELPSYFSHTRPNRKNYQTAYIEAGIYNNGYGENIAAGYSSPEYVVSGWMASPGHRANILNERFNVLATGYSYANDLYGDYYCQNFMIER